LLGETGIIGTLLYLSIYFGLMRSLVMRVREAFTAQSQLYPAACAALGLVIYMMTDSGYNNWLETGRITTIAWAMAGLLLKPVQGDLPAAAEVDTEQSVQPTGSGAYATPC